MKADKMEESLDIPEGIEVNVEGSLMKIKGSKGELSKEFRHPKVKIGKKDSKISISASKATKREKKIIGTFKAHIKNMIKGAKEGHVYRLRICSGHFPMNVSVSGNKFVIKNFLGEKIPRELEITEGVKVKIEGQDVVVEGIDKEKTGQAAASIEKLTTIKGRDKRIFQDGIYIINKDGKDIE